MTHLRTIWIAVAWILACGAVRANAVPAEPPSGDLRRDVAFVRLAVYLPKPVDGHPVKRVETLRAAKYAFLHPAADLSKDMALPAFLVDAPPIEDVPPPNAESLGYFGRGLSAQEILAAADSKQVVVMVFATARETSARVQAAALALTGDVAAELGGFVWDDETRLLYTLAEWRGKSFPADGLADVREHVSMHAYRAGELIRIVTLGMAKLGLPDVVVNGVSAEDSGAMGNLVNLVCQTLLEDGRLHEASALAVDIASLRNGAVRTAQSKNPAAGATGKATLRLRWAEPEEGDPDNRLLELDFGASDAQVEQAVLLAKVYGMNDAVAAVDASDRELQAARERAKRRLAELKPSLADGYDVDETLLVKAPFRTTDGGTEWMWVEMVSWKGSRIDGILQNEPEQVPSLRGGERVQVAEDDVFDFIHRRPDGTVEGNETSKVIERIAKERRTVAP